LQSKETFLQGANLGLVILGSTICPQSLAGHDAAITAAMTGKIVLFQRLIPWS
jgi:hypothetical protein